VVLEQRAGQELLVLRALQDLWVRQVQLAPQVPLEPPVMQDQLGRPVVREQQEPQDHRALSVLRDLKDLTVLPGHQVHRDLLEPQGVQDLLDLLERLVGRVFQARLVRLVLLDLLVLQVILEVQVPLVHQVHKVR